MDLPSAALQPSERINYAEDGYEELFNRYPAWKKLLTRVFPTAEEIEVRKRLSGYSGAYSWLISTKKREAKGEYVQVYIVKLAHHQLIRRERGKYKDFVSGRRLYGNPVVVEEELLPTDDDPWGLLLFSLAGNSQTQTLLEHLKTKGSNHHIEKVLGQVFNLHDERWAKIPAREITYKVYYDRYLPEHFHFDGLDTAGIRGVLTIKASRVQEDLRKLEKEVEQEPRPHVHLQDFQIEQIKERGNERTLTLSPNPVPLVGSFRIRVKYALAQEQAIAWLPEQTVSLFGINPKLRRELLKEYASDILKTPNLKKRTFSHDKVTYPNPIAYLEELLDRHETVKFSTIHGDLNLQNILVFLDEQQNLQHWLIDFADTGTGPVLLDFQWLETQIVLWRLAPALHETNPKLGKLVEIFRALEADQPCPTALGPKVEAPYAVLRQIRRMAQRFLMQPDDWAEYYRGLVIALLGGTRFGAVPEIDTYAPRVAFLSAAILLSWANVLTDQELKNISPSLWPPAKVPILTPVEPAINPVVVTQTVIPLDEEGMATAEPVNLTEYPMVIYPDPPENPLPPVTTTGRAVASQPRRKWGRAYWLALLGLLLVAAALWLPIPATADFRNRAGLLADQSIGRWVMPASLNGSAAEACRALRQAGQLAAAASIDSRPYTYRDAANVMQGIELEILKEVVRTCFGLEAAVDLVGEQWLTIKEIPVSERLTVLDTDPAVQVVAGSITHTPTRCNPNQGKICTEPYAVDIQALAAHAGGAIDSYCDADTQTVILLEGTTGKETLAGYIDFCRVKYNVDLSGVVVSTVETRQLALDTVADPQNADTTVYKANADLIRATADAFAIPNITIIPSSNPLIDQERVTLLLRNNHKGLRSLVEMVWAGKRERFQAFCQQYLAPIDKNCATFPVSVQSK